MPTIIKLLYSFCLQECGILFWRVVCFVLVEQVATAPVTLTTNVGILSGKRYGPRVHTINNDNPYQGVTVTEGHGKYPVIFEPLQNVQTSCSTYRVTSFIDFTPYLEYFQQFEKYLQAFKESLQTFEGDPILQEFQETTLKVTQDKKGEACRHYPACTIRPLLCQLRFEQAQISAYRWQKEHCMACHMQACLVLKQFEYILNITEYINENYLRVKDKFLKAIDYVENMNLVNATPANPQHRQKQSETRISDSLSSQEEKYLVQQMMELARWDLESNTTIRTKRFIPLITSIGAAIGSLLNAGQIKTIKKNIAVLQDATILQGQKIAELARYADLTAARV